MLWINSRWKAAGFAMATFCLATSHTAQAQAVALAAQAPSDAEATLVGNDTAQATQPIRILVGPQYVSGAAVRQPVRTEIAGGALVASFSPSPKQAGRNIVGFGQMPAGAPVSGRLTSGFGPRYHPIHGGERYHAGVDVAAPNGTPIRATSDGVISGAGWAGGYGLLVRIEHGNGIETRYAHMSAVNVAVGQQIHRGDVIGFVGSTGDSTGPHVHYEVRMNGRAVNPLVP